MLPIFFMLAVGAWLVARDKPENKPPNAGPNTKPKTDPYAEPNLPTVPECVLDSSIPPQIAGPIQALLSSAAISMVPSEVLAQAATLAEAQGYVLAAACLRAAAIEQMKIANTGRRGHDGRSRIAINSGNQSHRAQR